MERVREENLESGLKGCYWCTRARERGALEENVIVALQHQSKRRVFTEEVLPKNGEEGFYGRGFYSSFNSSSIDGQFGYFKKKLLHDNCIPFSINRLRRLPNSPG